MNLNLQANYISVNLTKIIDMNLFYYIDEAGTLNLDLKQERFFIMSCCITDNPENIRTQLSLLKKQIEDDIYFAEQCLAFKKAGFHATANHFDIRAKYYSLLNQLNLRIYSIIIDKAVPDFNKLLDRGRPYYEILYILLYQRILSNRQHSNFLVFEEYGAKPFNHQGNIQFVIKNIVDRINKEQEIDVDIKIVVHDKSDINLSTVDYANYVLFQMLQPRPSPKMEEIFRLLEPKIALIYSFFQKKFFSQINRINFDEIKSGVK